MKANIYELKNDVKYLLEEIKKLIEKAGHELSQETEFKKKCEDSQEKLDSEISKIDKLELRMAIAAPMKAGKSTIINAIMGRELLPQRERAMTTIPTEIVSAPKLTKPILKISDSSINFFKKAWEQLKKEVAKKEDFDKIREKINSYTQLFPLVDEIYQALEFPIGRETEGDKKIRDSLEKLNDLVRLCSLIAPHANPLIYLSDIPRIETPFLRIQGGKNEEMLGNLVIIDTPGPNEVGEDLKLADLVTKQLNIASLVLVVLDYTRLDDKTADEIKKDVKKIFKNMNNESSSGISQNAESKIKQNTSALIYILVNRIDQRRATKPEDIEKDQENIRRFVCSRYEIPLTDHSKQLFEISAIKAFIATRLLLELQEHPQKEIAELESLDPFLKAACEDAWKIMRSNFLQGEKSGLKDFAYSTVWKNSGFAPFLENAIDSLMLKAAPLCLENALLTTFLTVSDWQKPVELRRNANDKEKTEIEDAIKLVEDYLNDLENFLENKSILKVLTNKTEKIKEETNKQLTKTKEECENHLRGLFLEVLLTRFEKQYKNESLTSLKSLDFKVRDKILRTRFPVIADFLKRIENIMGEHIPLSIISILKYKVTLVGANEIRFDNQEAAEEFRKSVTSDAWKIVNRNLGKFVKEIHKITKYSQKEIERELISKTQESLEKVLNHLNKEFDIGLNFPLFSEGNINFKNDLNIVRINEEKKAILSIAFEQIFSIFTKKKVSRNIYSISLPEMVEEINEELKKKFDDLHKSMDIFLEKDLTLSINEFSDNLQKKVKSLQQGLEQSLDDKLREEEAQKFLINKLDDLVNKSNVYLTDIEEKIKYIEKFTTDQ